MRPSRSRSGWRSFQGRWTHYTSFETGGSHLMTLDLWPKHSIDDDERCYGVQFLSEHIVVYTGSVVAESGCIVMTACTWPLPKGNRHEDGQFVRGSARSDDAYQKAETSCNWWVGKRRGGAAAFTGHCTYSDTYTACSTQHVDTSWCTSVLFYVFLCVKLSLSRPQM